MEVADNVGVRRSGRLGIGWNVWCKDSTVLCDVAGEMSQHWNLVR